MELIAVLAVLALTRFGLLMLIEAWGDARRRSGAQPLKLPSWADRVGYWFAISVGVAPILFGIALLGIAILRL